MIIVTDPDPSMPNWTTSASTSKRAACARTCRAAAAPSSAPSPETLLHKAALLRRFLPQSSEIEAAPQTPR